MKKMYSLQMEHNSYADDYFVTNSAFDMIFYCLKYDIFVDGLENRIAYISVDDDGYSLLIHELFRIDYDASVIFLSGRDGAFHCLVPVDYDGSDV